MFFITSNVSFFIFSDGGERVLGGGRRAHK